MKDQQKVVHICEAERKYYMIQNIFFLANKKLKSAACQIIGSSQAPFSSECNQLSLEDDKGEKVVEKFKALQTFLNKNNINNKSFSS